MALNHCINTCLFILYYILLTIYSFLVLTKISLSGEFVFILELK